MKEERFKLKSHMDDLPLSVILIEPEIEPKGVVQILHDMCEHKERYKEFMNYLALQGFVCIIHDHRGHGESVRSKEDLGYFYKHGAKALIEDTNIVNRYARKRYRGLPIYILGQGMGSLIARAYIKRNDRVIDGLILSGSPSNYTKSKLGIYVAKATSYLAGDRTEGSFFQKAVMGKYNDNIEDVNSENSWICSNEKVVEAYDQDELCGFMFTNNGFENLFKLMTWVYEDGHWHVNNRNLPIWFISGEEDPCLIDKKKYKEAVKHLRQRGYTNVTYQLYKGMRHEILNEEYRMKVYRDIVTQLEIWVDRRQ